MDWTAWPVCWDEQRWTYGATCLARSQEALFATAMQGRQAEREELARLLHDHHPRTQHPAKPGGVL